jgi:hypothetical protein
MEIETSWKITAITLFYLVYYILKIFEGIDGISCYPAAARMMQMSLITPGSSLAAQPLRP